MTKRIFLTLNTIYSILFIIIGVIYIINDNPNNYLLILIFILLGLTLITNFIYNKHKKE